MKKKEDSNEELERLSDELAFYKKVQNSTTINV
jgi:hypothetical protein